ncbi:LysR family transcriptional regulator [Edwardsiella anguillarum]|nr:LysR family transcriptional regulator [Edwardsiella anguillarum]
MLNAYTLHQLSVFVRIIEMGSLSKAARELGLSRSAVSKSLATLEQQLGVLLIKRSTRRLFLTEQGAAVFNRAIMLLDACRISLLNCIVRRSQRGTASLLLGGLWFDLFA